MAQLSPVEHGLHKLLDHFQATPLLDLSFSVSPQQVQRALQVIHHFPHIDQGADKSIYKMVPEAFRDHLKSALFLLNKCMQQKQLSFQQIAITHPENLLIRLARLLPIEYDAELSLNLLKTILALLEKFEKINKALPVVAIRQS